MPMSEAFTRLSVKVTAGTQSAEDKEPAARRPGRTRSAAPVIHSASVDVVLVKDMPMAEAVAELLTYLRTTFDQAEGDQYDAIRDRLADPWAYWQLVSPTGHHYPGEQKLSETGLVDGDTLVLVDSRQRENYRPLIDDAAEAIAHDQRRNFADWTSGNSRALAAACVPLAALAAVVALVIGASTGALGTIGQYITGGVLLFSAILALVGAANAYVAETDADSERVLAGVIASGYLLLGGAGLILVPDGPNAYAMLLAGGLVFAGAWTISRTVAFPDSVNYAAQVVGMITAITAALALLSGGGPLGTSLGLGALTLGFVALASSRMALTGSKIPMPEVPAQGETTFLRDDDDLQSFDNATRNEVIAEIINHEDHSVTARGILVGTVWGSVVLLTVAAAISGYTGMSGSTTQAWCTLVFWLAVVLAALFRGKNSGDAAQQGSWLAGAFLIATTFTLACALSGERISMTLAAVALLAAGTLLGTWAASRGKVLKSPSWKRALEFVEGLCFSIPPVMWALAIGLFGEIRGMM